MLRFPRLNSCRFEPQRRSRIRTCWLGGLRFDDSSLVRAGGFYRWGTACVLRSSIVCVAMLLSIDSAFAVEPQIPVKKGKSLYRCAMDSQQSVADWSLEGPGKLAFQDGWMTMWSPGEEMHHVLWCPQNFPDRYIAQWTMQNLHPEAGLCIVFFSATGLNGEDVLDSSLPKRDGTFSQYNKGQLKNYHISYYANTPNRPDRAMARLRKNPGANIVQEGPRGILADSQAIHRATLVKDRSRILLFVDDRKIIDWTDDGKVITETYGGGKIALRQMQWTKFRYRDFQVWAIDDNRAPEKNSASGR